MGALVFVAIAIVRLRSSPLLNFEMFGPWRYWADGLEIADAGRVPAHTLQWGSFWTPTVSKVVLNSYHAALSYAIGRAPLPAMGALLWVASTGLAAGLWALGRELGLRRLAPLLPLLPLAVLNDELRRNLDVYTAENVGRMVAVCALILGCRALRDRDGWKEPLLAALLFGAGFATHGVPVVALMVALGLVRGRPGHARPGSWRAVLGAAGRDRGGRGRADGDDPARLGRLRRLPGGVGEQLLRVVRQRRRPDRVAALRHAAALADRPRPLVRATRRDHARLHPQRDDAQAGAVVARLAAARRRRGGGRRDDGAPVPARARAARGRRRRHRGDAACDRVSVLVPLPHPDPGPVRDRPRVRLRAARARAGAAGAGRGGRGPAAGRAALDPGRGCRGGGGGSRGCGGGHRRARPQRAGSRTAATRWRCSTGSTSTRRAARGSSPTGSRWGRSRAVTGRVSVVEGMGPVPAAGDAAHGAAHGAAGAPASSSTPPPGWAFCTGSG